MTYPRTRVYETLSKTAADVGANAHPSARSLNKREFEEMSDVQSLRDRLFALLMHNPPRQSRWPEDLTAQVTESMRTIQPDGSWPDLPYLDVPKGAWKTSQHLSRLLMMARVYRDPRRKPLAGSKPLKNHILNAIDCWLKHDRRGGAGMWWHDIVHIPRTLANILLLMQPELSPRRLQRATDILKRSWPGSWGALTGQNLVWLAEVTLMRACLQDDRAMVAQTLNNIASTLTPADREAWEGIQPDFSFHQHGPQLYNGGYGWDFTHDAPRLAWAAHTTPFQFTAANIDVLSAYLLDAQQWMFRKRWFDYAVQGRELGRNRNHEKYKQLIHACELMIDMNVPRTHEFERLANRLQRNTSRGEPVGHRHFWRSDFMIHRRPGWMVSLKMSSARTFNTEELRGENFQNAHQTDGVMQILRTGTEYKNILPVWDWRRLPGITCRTGAGLVQPRPNNQQLYLKSRFVGGVSDGHYGLAAFDFHDLDGFTSSWGPRRPDGTCELILTDHRLESPRAHKTWFCFDREIVCLGAAINGPAKLPAQLADQHVLTSVNQCLLRTPVIAQIGKSQTTLEPGRHTDRRFRWVHHDRIAYVFPEPADLTVAAQSQTGSRDDVNKYHRNAPEASRKVFSLWLDHGVTPNNDHYAYAIVPNVTPGQLTDYLESWPIEIIANEPNLQAVRHQTLRLTQAAFYKPGRLACPDARTVRVDRPCLLMLHDAPDALTLSIANPENEPGIVNVDIATKLTGPNCTWLPRKRTSRITIDLPTGLYAGQSVTLTLNKAT